MLQTEIDNRGVAFVWLDRAKKHNALSANLIDMLSEIFIKLEKDNAVRLIVLAAHGDTFCAGGDLDWMRQQFGAAPENRRIEARRLADMLNVVNRLTKPVIARVQGNAFGGGIGLMSVADVSIGVHGAKFGLTEVRLGIIPATIGPYVLARMSQSDARRYFFSGRKFDAVDANRMGLLAEVVEPEQLDAAVESEITPYLNAAPGAIAAAKKLCLSRNVTARDIDESVEALVARWEDREAQEGVAAFFARSAPPWS